MKTTPEEKPLDLDFVDRLTARVGARQSQTLVHLHAIQKEYGYLPPEALQRLSEATKRPLDELWGVVTFYDQFRFTPAGQHQVRVCVGTACHVKGADLVYDAMRRHLEIAEGKDTDAQRLFTVQRVACLGCCTLAPAVQIDNVTYGHVSSQTVPLILQDFLERQKALKRGPDKKAVKAVQEPDGQIRIGLGSCCQARGSGKLLDAIEQSVARLSIRARIKQVGCVGMCYQTPLLELAMPSGQTFLYTRVEPEDAESILLKHFSPAGRGRLLMSRIGRTLDRFLTDTIAESVSRHPVHVRDPQIADFLGCQKRVATEHCGIINPLDLEEYKQKDGFAALEKILREGTPEEALGQIEASGLRGRGGAGYPTYLKWSAVQKSPASIKRIVCNGDEGDPGAFMDRMLMESYPLRILEGMIIAAWTVGASEGHLYIRDEYPLAVERIQGAIEICQAHGYLGQHILGTEFSLDLSICCGAGAFVCGEETALMASIEGRRPMPRLRPPFPAQHGLWGCPTLINNVETYSVVPWILRNGGRALAQMGTPQSRGTKVFALAGKVIRGGLIEVPMGATVRQIVEEIGGGVGEGKKFKAVQIGGPSGGCVPAELSDISVDYESLSGAGAIMGSGGLVALDEGDCMVDIARYFLEFTQQQSCGKCTFCRVGAKRMLEILQRLCNGQGHKGDIERLEELARLIRQNSLCGLGRTAPNPVLSTIAHFRDEYEAHINGRCPAKRCRAMIHYSINTNCIGCTLCAQHCPAEAIAMRPYERHEIDPSKCVRCGTCKNVCPAEAVDVE